MARVKTHKTLTLDVGLANMAPEEEMLGIRLAIALVFQRQGNPVVVNAKQLTPWAPYLPRLEDEGVLVKYVTVRASPKEEKVEYELAEAHRKWIVPESVIDLFRSALKEKEDSQVGRIYTDLALVYSHNPGVPAALFAERNRVINQPSLGDYIKALGPLRSHKNLRYLAEKDWTELVDELVEAEDPDCVLIILDFGVPYRGSTTGLKLAPRDLWALAQATTIRDVEFILDHLDIQRPEVERVGSLDEA